MPKKKKLKLHLKEGRVTTYMKRKYGQKAFTKDGKIKISYLDKAIKECKDPDLKKHLFLLKP